MYPYSFLGSENPVYAMHQALCESLAHMVGNCSSEYEVKRFFCSDTRAEATRLSDEAMGSPSPWTYQAGYETECYITLQIAHLALTQTNGTT